MVFGSQLEVIRRYAIRILPIFAIALSGCATLPASGPTGGEVRKTADTTVAGEPITIVEVDEFAELPAAEGVGDIPFPNRAPRQADRIDVGDTLDIYIYEAGVALFGGPERTTGPSLSLATPSVSTEGLPPIRVSDSGTIQVPYAGTLKVAGMSIAEVQSVIRRSLRGLSENPQVLVAVRDAVSNTLIVGGEVQRPGRLPLVTSSETLSDVVALAGGYRGDAKDLEVRVVRDGQTATFRLSNLLDGDLPDVLAFPGDRILVMRQPRSFSVLGASGRVDLLPFGRSSVVLAEAVAQAGGVNPTLGDAAAVFVFRFVVDEEGFLKPIVYHFDLRRTGAYFQAKRFLMRDEDVLYIGNARANQPAKLVQLISQLFSPLLTITTAAQVVNSN